MRFAKIVFWSAGIWGVLVLTPLYFLLDTIGRQTPPALTHPQFYFGFVGVALEWQIAFLVIATDPVRFRPMIIAALLEKLTFIGTITVLYSQRRIVLAEAIPAVPDAILAVLFAISFVRTKPSPAQS
jgi:uncharacterized membrane protein